MATGYTYAVKEGKITDFRDFAMECARAFGALITMRDEPQGAAIPDEFKIDTDRYDRSIREAEKRLKSIHGMTAAECQQAADECYEAALKDRERNRQRTDEERARYDAMLTKVKEWKPPSPDHTEMKAFMIDQLEKSIDFDCRPSSLDSKPARQTGAQWKADELARAERNLAYYTAEKHKEIDRVQSRNRWLRQLRESLESASDKQWTEGS